MTILALVPVLAALAGVLVGGLISELRVALEMRRERKKALNRVLWCQLDLWHDLERYDLKDLLDLFLKRLARRMNLPLDQTGLIIPDADRNILAEIIGEVVGSSRRPGLDEDYDASVEALAMYDPLLAVQLSGKTSLAQHRIQSDAYVTSVIDRFAAPLDDTTHVERLRPWIYKENLDTARRILRSDIEAVARSLSRCRWRAVQRSLVAVTEKVGREQEQLIDQGIDRLVEQFRMLAAGASPPPTESPRS